MKRWQQSMLDQMNFLMIAVVPTLHMEINLKMPDLVARYD